MNNSTVLILAASVGLLSADLSLAKGSGNGRMNGYRQYGAQAPDSAKHTRKQTRDKLQDQARTPVQTRTRDRSQAKTTDSIVLP